MNKKQIYNAPSTTLTTVEMEGQICSASSEIRNPDAANGRIDDQTINSGFNSDFGGDDEWIQE